MGCVESKESGQKRHYGNPAMGPRNTNRGPTGGGGGKHRGGRGNYLFFAPWDFSKGAFHKAFFSMLRNLVIIAPTLVKVIFFESEQF